MKHGDKVSRTVYELSFDARDCCRETLLERAAESIYKDTRLICPVCECTACDNWECLITAEEEAKEATKKWMWIAAALKDMDLEAYQWLRDSLAIDYYVGVVEESAKLKEKAAKLLSE